ncbi:Na+/H+ antiporter subunit E, partial [Falsiroseomonas oryziterrae]|uniref:Na+/H+ antiporter subunit E n=1 Tax=Falsiroseomonas oryziterrae TaxID=2911368 RepID=UPI001F302A4C
RSYGAAEQAASPPPPVAAPKAALARGAALFALWLVLAGTDPLGLGFGLLAAALGARASLRLLPPGQLGVSRAGLGRVALRVLRESALAGWDVARRALSRDMRLSPGIVLVPLQLPPGPVQDGFRLLASLAPGALPLAGGGGVLSLHVLDTRERHDVALAAMQREMGVAEDATR